MGTAKFAQLKSIFSHALELKEGEVAAYLDESCVGNPSLRAQVEEMLRQAATADTALMTNVGEEPAHALKLGSVLGQRFVLKRFIGRGGMGEVYLAEDLELEVQVALKTVRAGLLGTQGVARFKREVQLSRQVTHPNICRVFDVGKEDVNGQPVTFLTMEFLEGETLAQHMAKKGKMSLEMAEPLVRQMAKGLGALHEKGIMHRDLKPANVMLVRSRLCIMDFGLARVFEGEGSDAHYTQTGAILGTPGYMSPEQLMGETATAASDIYAMGLLIFEMVTGKKASLVDTLAAGKTGLPANWETVILRCVARDASLRPKTAVEALAGLSGAEPKKRKPLLLAGAAVMIVAGLVSIPMFRTGGGGTSLPQSTVSVNDKILRARQLLERYYKPQNVQEAMKILEQVVAENPKLALGHATLGAAQFRLFVDTRDVKLLEAAKEACDRAIGLDAEMAEPHLTLGNIYLATGRKDLARSELSTALKLDSKSADVHFVLAQLYRAEGRKAEQEEAIQKAIDLAPNQWAYHNWRSGELRDQGKHGEALAEIAIAEKLMPDNPLIYNNMGILYMRTREFAKAREAFLKSNELEPRARTMGNLGTVYYLEKSYVEAAEILKKAADLEPKSYLPRANLAAALDRTPATKAEAMVAYRKAIEVAEPLLEATPNDERILGNVASYHAVLGNREQATALIRRAVALQPESPVVAQRAIAVYEFLKDRELALQWAAKALKNGYPLETLKSDPELAGLVADPRFQNLEAIEKEKRK